MNQIGRRIFYDVLNGNVLVDTGEMCGFVTFTTIEQDITRYSILSKLDRESFDVLELPFGAYSKDFAECNGYRVNLETKQLEFSYPDPNETETTEPVYQKPLSEEVEELKAENNLLKAQNQALTERTDFHEELIAEMAMMVYS